MESLFLCIFTKNRIRVLSKMMKKCMILDLVLTNFTCMNKIIHIIKLFNKVLNK